MDFDLSPEQRELRRATIAFARSELGAAAADDDRESRFPARDWARCAEHGVLGWPVPARYGGRGLDPLSTMIALEALGYGCRDNGLVFAVNNHLWGCAVYLLLHGTEEQKTRYLKPMCDGALVGAHALSEPEAGSDVLGLRTTAVRDGDHYVLDGTKWFVSNGPVADVFVVLARTGGETGGAAGGGAGRGRAQDALSAFLVTADLPGVHRTREFTKLGLRSTPMGAVEFDGARVPAGNLLGREGSGYAIFNATIEWERAFMFAGHLGVMERLLESSIAHASSRRQFGRAIGGFQAVAHEIADMKIRLELARLILYRVGWLKRERRLALQDATIAKIFVSESLVRTAMAAVQVHGARGYLNGYDLERELRDALGGPIFAGTSAVQRGILAELLGLSGVLSGAPEGG
ncbi:acyl-CoA dehydrogenase family protein [Actinomadura viridis]|uniref:Alkylation response protein AidB-like acyl-CoA dehydrogenase n=1 Tax=Actinomadura viridis TaxID=58110 RepID=A0A931GKQ4_9ACTN|nr:acyl-CoA dehydrogenase family protein [Actinomadura viridis]MBG6090380.1 alkylation response protein AidB-like acyl-CoA dehydrogenase [Actinomadura viridis]